MFFRSVTPFRFFLETGSNPADLVLKKKHKVHRLSVRRLFVEDLNSDTVVFGKIYR